MYTFAELYEYEHMTITPARIVVVDDEEDVLVAARLLLKRHFTSVETFRDPGALPDLAHQNAFDVLLLDMNFVAGSDSGAEGLKWLSRVLTIDPNAVVVLVTAHSDVELAVEAMKRGATDFVTKPWENERLIATVLAALRLHRSRSESAVLRERNRGLTAATLRETELLGTSAEMQKVFAMVRRAAPTDANVLILGENGTGKELVARELHRRSNRANDVFLRIDLGSLSPQIFEGELFGAKRGAFTDAKEDRIGLFRAASGGTLFLDEIGNVPLHLQSKLLTALERREVMALGSAKVEPIDVRIISATNLPIEKLRDPNTFRPDLLHRIDTVEITLPPLRDRGDDIPLLLNHFIAHFSRKYNTPVKHLSAAALQRLTTHVWPGNVRALQHAVERAIILSEGTTYEATDFHLPANNEGAEEPATPDHTLETIEKNAISEVLRRHDGNVSRAAKALGLTRPALYRRMVKYGL